MVSSLKGVFYEICVFLIVREYGLGLFKVVRGFRWVKFSWEIVSGYFVVVKVLIYRN